VIKNFVILNREYGFWRSMREGRCVDRQGRPLPWITYPAIEYLRGLDFRDKRIFEFGAGASTLFWAERARQVVSVESDPAWYERVRPQLPPHVEIHLAEEASDFVSVLEAQEIAPDVIVIDGIERRGCSEAALAQLARGGVVILDNSDWYFEEAALLRTGGLLQVDFTGFGPLSGCTTTTSFFFHRDFAFRPSQDRQPLPGIGSSETFGNLLGRWGLG
jgi:hypothetical protein